ncbi:MAG: 50S ribosomal protein L10 [Actinomycetota bacterium]
MPRTEKVEKVTELTERIRRSQALFVTDYRGLSVSDISELRRALQESGTKLTVAKNTLLRLAAGEAGVDGLRDLFDGPSAVAFVDGDPIGAAKGLADAVRRFRTLEIRGGLMEGRVLSSAEAAALATIEPREVLLSKIAGALKAEMSRAAYMFQALQSRFLSVLDAYREKLPAPAAEEPEAAAAAGEEQQPPAEEAAPTGETAETAADEASATQAVEASATEAVEAPETEAVEASETEAEGVPEAEAADGEETIEDSGDTTTDEPAEGDAGEEGKE